MSEPTELRETLHSQALFLEHILSKLKSHAEYAAPYGGISGYHASVDVPEIPEWELRRNLDDIRSTLG